MADANLSKFDKRVGRINKRHDKFARQGYVTAVSRDGLITARTRSRGPRFPWRGIAAILMIFFVFKSVVLIKLGETGYNERIAALESGTLVEQVGAYAMRADPVTKWIAEQIGVVVK